MSIINKSTFREDINGLRAIAVLSVIIFHFIPEKLPGGFVGVDIFFVISGYLMTSIIFRGLINNNFLFISFIINRITRILPALLTITILLLILGYISLGPDAYQLLGKHIRDSLLFISNITYEQESGYFDVASNTKFLLHTWSLSVEWQFYLIYPIALLILNRFISIANLKLIIIFLLFISFAASVYITKKNPETAYFLFYTRAWEMMFGGVAFLYPFTFTKVKYRSILEIIGFSLILLSIFTITPSTPWPGYMALLPVLGTYLCISANNPNTLLSGYLINKVGLWSYSIYLVHWPLIVFNQQLNWQLSFKQYILITFILAFTLYQLIEKRRHYKWGLAIIYFVVLMFAMYIKNTNGIEARFNIPKESKESLILGGININPNEWKEFNTTQNNSYDFIFYGDSFNAQYDHYIQTRKESIAMLYHPECLSTPNIYSHRITCKPQYDFLKKNMTGKKANILVMPQAWTVVFAGLKNKATDEPVKYNTENFLIHLKNELIMMRNELGFNKIIIVGDNSRFTGPSPQECLSRKFTKTIYDQYTNNSVCSDITDITPYINTFNQKLKEFAKEEEWLYFIDPNEAFCTSGKCILFENNLSLFSDRAHFSSIGSNKVGDFIFKHLEKIQNEKVDYQK